MVKAAWGAKRTCQGCAARFYDLNKDPIICPKCGHAHDADDFVKARRVRGASALPAAEAKKPPAPKKSTIEGVPIADDELPQVDGDDEDEAIEDTDDLNENEDLDVDIASDKDETER